MADVKNSLELMKKNLSRMGVLDRIANLKSRDLEEQNLRDNNPKIFLQLMNYLIVEYSTALYTEILEIVPDIKMVNDRKFVESSYLVMRDILQCIPIITVDQFLTSKFLDLKLQLIGDLARKVYEWDQSRKTKKVRNQQFQKVPEKYIRKLSSDEDEEEPKQLSVAPTRISKQVDQRPQKLPERFSERLPQRHPQKIPQRLPQRIPQRLQQRLPQRIASQQSNEISQVYELLGQMNTTVNELVQKFNALQNNITGWVNNINAKLTILQDKVRIIQTNM